MRAHRVAFHSPAAIPRLAPGDLVMSTESQSRAARLRSFYRRLHLSEPDFTRPRLELCPGDRKAIMDKLVFLYGDEAEACFAEISRVLRVYYAHKPLEMIDEERHIDPAERFTEKDAVLITYGDLIRSPERRPLRALADFLRVFMGEAINVIHILPFFPSSSDRGFSITDYEEVDPQLGGWEDIELLSTRYRLMFDGVFNHVSSKSRWFQQFLNSNPHYKDFFIRFSTREEVSPDHRKLILRPRVNNLLTGFDTVEGKRFVWTTFSPDQIDLNFKNINVLVRVVEILLFYVRWGADLIRLDAVTYLWTELGTSCAHLGKTHALVQLFRAILNVAAPHVVLVTETNVAHADNVSYFGDGTNEAQMVYNFALPPLVLYSFQQEDCTKLSRWAATLDRFSDTCTYFNFLDSHDGIGLSAVEYSAMNQEESDETVDLQVSRFLASRAIALGLRGVPGIYLPSLFGARNDLKGVLESGDPRSINRKNIDEEALLLKLGDRTSSSHKVSTGFGNFIDKRRKNLAFHPNGSQKILLGNPAVFSLVRVSPDDRQRVVALVNVSARGQQVCFPAPELGLGSSSWIDILTDEGCPSSDGGIAMTLEPYQIRWLCPE